MNILFVTGRLPYPPLKGDQVISYHRMKALGGRHRITLISFYRGESELDYLKELEPLCEEVIAVKWSTAVSLGSMLFGGVFSGLPFQVLYFLSPEFRKTFGTIIAGKDFDIIHVYMLRMAEYAAGLKTPKILDLIDPMHLNYRRRASIEKPFLRTAFRVEARRLEKYENDIVKKYDFSILVSARDMGLYNSDRVSAVSLGVDTEFFRNDEGLSHDPTIVFSGNMGYLPNESAVFWFVDNCLGAIRKEIPDVRLVVAGNNPSSKLRSLDDGRTILVTGFVESMPRALCKARLAIAPMHSGYGMHIKMLEAMSCSLPVVCTSQALGTIEAVSGISALIADDVGGFCRHCVSLLLDYETARSIGISARELVKGRYSWEAHAREIEKIYLNALGAEKT